VLRLLSRGQRRVEVEAAVEVEDAVEVSKPRSRCQRRVEVEAAVEVLRLLSRCPGRRRSVELV
jgi:hypothetical protein